MTEILKSDESAATSRATKQSGVDQLAELEKRAAGVAERIREKNSELRELVSRQRKTEAQIRELKDKQLNDFLKASGIGEFSPDAWRAAESEIKAILARNSSKR